MIGLVLEFLPMILGIVLFKALQALSLDRDTVVITTDGQHGNEEEKGESQGGAIAYADYRNFENLAKDLMLTYGYYSCKSKKCYFRKIGLVSLKNTRAANALAKRRKMKRLMAFAESADEIEKCFTYSAPFLLAYIIGFDLGVVNA
ncbi:MAG: hypothetical protein ACP5T4_01935 [Candidatus Micrarchaeia archaeon]